MQVGRIEIHHLTSEDSWYPSSQCSQAAVKTSNCCNVGRAIYGHMTHTWRTIKRSLTFVPITKNPKVHQSSNVRVPISNPILDNMPMVVLQGLQLVFQGKGHASNKRQQGNCNATQSMSVCDVLEASTRSQAQVLKVIVHQVV